MERNRSRDNPKCSNLLASGPGGAREASRFFSVVSSGSARCSAVAMFPAIKDTMLMLDRMAEAEVQSGL